MHPAMRPANQILGPAIADNPYCLASLFSQNRVFETGRGP